MNQRRHQLAYHHMSTQLASRLAELSVVIKNLPHIIEWTAKALFMLTFFLYLMVLIAFTLKPFFIIDKTQESKQESLALDWLRWSSFILLEILWHSVGFLFALVVVSTMPDIRILQLPLLIISVLIIRFCHNYFVVCIAFNWILLRFRKHRMVLPPIYHRGAYAALMSTRPLPHSVAA